MSAGIEIHFLSIRDVLKPEHSFTDILRVGVEIDRANGESVLKSERVGEAWSKKRKQANGKTAMSARVPLWLKAVKGQPIQVIPERAAIIKKIFEWAAKGLGQYLICDKLIAVNTPAWGPVYKGNLPRWSHYYVSAILSSRSVIGEYQPHTKKLIDGVKQRVPDGAVVENYYPTIIPLSLFQSVQDSRRAFAQAKFGASLYGGKDLHSGKNLFKKLVYDANNNEPMVYRYGTSTPCLVTTHRKNVKQHKINYARFENLVLEFLRVADWKNIAQSGQSTATLELLAKQEILAREIDDYDTVVSRYEAMIDDPNSTDFERIRDKYKTAVSKSKKLREGRAALEQEISSQNTDNDKIFSTSGLDIISIDRQSKEGRLKLRSYLAQRISRIDLTFNATVLTDGPVDVEPGTGKIVTKISFVNGAAKWIFFQGDRAVLLS